MAKNAISIQLTSDINAFFVDQVHEVARKQGLEMSRHTQEYLASILSRFADAKSYLLRQPDNNGSDKIQQSFPTLALLFLESCQSPATHQFFKLLHLGDVALFTSGFFGERVLKNSLDMDYYIAMGGMAYERAGKIRESIATVNSPTNASDSAKDQAINVYFELSKSFKEFVEVFAELSDQSLLASDKDILKLYEKWLASKSYRVARMLGEVGVIPNAGKNEGA